MKKHGELIFSETSFQFDDHFHDGKIWWTARFVCPVTKEIYEAGTLSDQDMYTKWTWSRGDRRVPLQVENKLYYQRLKTAIHAAAARKLDALSYQKVGQSEHHFCIEDPSLPPKLQSKEATAKTVSQSVVNAQQGTENLVIASDSLKAGGTVVPNVSKKLPKGGVLPDFEFAASRSPKDALHQYYSRMQTKLESDAFESTLHSQKAPGDASWWSASFVCPLSGKTYRSGSLLDEKKFGEVRYLDGKPYYSRLKSATHAASGIALEDMYFQLTGSVNAPRLCGDDPSLPSASFEHPDAKNRQLAKPKPGKVKDIIGLKHLEEDIEGAAEVSSDDFILRSVSSPSLNSTTTLERVMAAWSDNAATSNSSSQSSMSETTTALPLTWTPLQERRKILNDAKGWLGSVRVANTRSKRFIRFHNPIQVTSLTSCNSILSALAKANQIRNGSDVQEIADKIFSFLWSGPKPNAETYNAYMQCLGSEPRDVARKAQEILEDMLSGKKVAGKNIPKPTVDVFNTAIKLWALTGDTGKCQEIFELMVSAGVEADRDTCFNMFSSLAHGKFDGALAKNGLLMMESIGILDNEAYLAPLRWGGKRFDARTIPWDSFSDIYSEGFKDSAIDQTQIEAEAVEEWVSNMEQMEHIEVTVGCHEAVIQAWVRTGTLEGLERAESWAQRLFDDAPENNLQPTVQTLYPILAARAYSGEEPAKLKGWMNRIEWSNTLQSDGRVSSMLLLAWRRHEESLNSAGTDYDISKGKLTATESLKELTNICAKLEKYHCEEGNPPSFLETSAFCEALSCWGSFGKRRAQSEDHAEAKVAMDTIIQIVLQFQTAISNLHGVLHEQDQDDVEEDQDSEGETSSSGESPKSMLDLQLQHLLHGAPGVYRCAISCLDEIEQSRCTPPSDNEGTRNSSTMLRLPDIENMLRSVAEYRFLLRSRNIQAATDVHYADGFSCYGDSAKYMATHSELCSKVVEGLAKQRTYQFISDQARIMALIVDMMLDNKQANSDTSQLSSICLEIVQVLQSVQRTKEKEAVLQHFLKIVSGKANSSNGMLDMNALVKAAKVRLDESRDATRESGSGNTRPRARSGSGSFKRAGSKGREGQAKRHQTKTAGSKNREGHAKRHQTNRKSRRNSV